MSDGQYLHTANILAAARKVVDEWFEQHNSGAADLNSAIAALCEAFNAEVLARNMHARNAVPEEKR